MKNTLICCSVSASKELRNPLDNSEIIDERFLDLLVADDDQDRKREERDCRHQRLARDHPDPAAAAVDVVVPLPADRLADADNGHRDGGCQVENHGLLGFENQNLGFVVVRVELSPEIQNPTFLCYTGSNPIQVTSVDVKTKNNFISAINLKLNADQKLLRGNK